MRRTTTSLATFCSSSAVALFLVTSACGKRGDPLPPLRPYPAAAQDVTIAQIGDRIQLQWRAPARNTDGTTEKLELAAAEVRRRVIDMPALVEAQTQTIEPEPAEETVDEPEAEEPSPAPVTPPEETTPPGEPASEGSAPVEDEEPEAPSVPALQVPNFAPESRYVTTLESTTPGTIETFEEKVDPEWLGLRVEYAVIYINRGDRRGERSRVVQIDPVAPLPAPGPPRAEAGDGFVVVRWEPAGVDSPAVDDGDAHYSVFRRAGAAEAYPARPVNPEPITETELVDRSVPFGSESCYRVKTVLPPPAESMEATAGDGDTEAEHVEEPQETPVVVVPEVPPLGNPVRIESEPSPEICLVPTDTFAPPAPTGLVAVRSGDDVLLTWSQSEQTDVTGYRVYRAASANGPFELLNEELLRVPTYSDGNVAAGETYYYGVTAVDDAPVANESTMSDLYEVTIGAR